MKKIKLSARDENGEIIEVVELSFDDPEIQKLDQFLENYRRLKSARIFESEFPRLQNINFEAGKEITFKISDFDYGQVCELLHVARPILLKKEPFSFENTQAVIGKKAKGTSIAKHLKTIRSIYEQGEYQPYFQFTVNNIPLFHDETLKLWLNGVEFHQDSEKAEVIKNLQKALTEKIVRGIFVSQLSGRIKAIFMLAYLAELITKNDEI